MSGERVPDAATRDSDGGAQSELTAETFSDRQSPASPDHGARLAHGVGISALTLAAYSARAVYGVLVARLLGGEALGSYVLSFAWIDLLSQAGTMGLDTAALVAGAPDRAGRSCAWCGVRVRDAGRAPGAADCARGWLHGAWEKMAGPFLATLVALGAALVTRLAGSGQLAQAGAAAVFVATYVVVLRWQGVPAGDRALLDVLRGHRRGRRRPGPPGS